MRINLSASCFCLILAALVAVPGLGVGPALAQKNLAVRPIEAQFSMRPGRTGQLNITIRNSDPTKAEVLQVAITNVRQASSGRWRMAEPDNGGSSTDAPTQSARDWLSVPSDAVEVAPGSTRQLPVEVDVPRRARGVYFAAITLLTEAPEVDASQGRQAGFRMRYRFLIPVIIEIEGRSVRQKVSLSDLDMKFVEDSEDFETPTTVASVAIKNAGRSFPEVSGRLLVEREVGGDWRAVTRISLPGQQVAPKNGIRVRQDLDRRLPSGDYRLRADARVDGRRIAPLTKTIDFEGDPEADNVAYDARLKTEPDVVTYEVAPGTVRARTIRVKNNGVRPVNVRTQLQTPAPLRGVVMGDLRGEALSASDWLTVRPGEVRLRPQQQRRIRVMARVPREAQVRAHHYARAKLTATYPDGQSAGQATALIHLTGKGSNADGEATIEGMALDSMGGDAGAYAVSASLRNVSTVHLKPTVRMRLVDPDGDVRRSVELQGPSGWLLPLEGRKYAGELGTAKLDAGRYTLVVDARFPDADPVRKEASLRVVTQKPAAERSPADDADYVIRQASKTSDGQVR